MDRAVKGSPAVPSAWQMQKVDQALDEIRPFVEMRLIEEPGGLRLVQKMVSASRVTPSDSIGDRLHPVYLLPKPCTDYAVGA
jgi:hypothetical protein